MDHAQGRLLPSGKGAQMTSAASSQNAARSKTGVFKSAGPEECPLGLRRGPRDQLGLTEPPNEPPAPVTAPVAEVPVSASARTRSSSDPSPLGGVESVTTICGEPGLLNGCSSRN